MSWQDRVSEAAYTAPSGVRLTFQFEDVSRETDKRTALFRFPGVSGAYVQDNLFGERRYPLRCYFSGPTHDLEATTFELALLERGAGRLEHPFYGTFDAIAFGTITRRDDLKSAANQSIVEVTFYSTIGALYPSGLTSPRNELLAALDAVDITLAQDFEEQTDVSTAAARAGVKSTTRSLVRIVADALAAAAAGVTAVDRDFRDAQQAVNYGIDLLVGQPLALAGQVSNLVKAPARALVGIEMRLAGYRQLAESIFGRTTLPSSLGVLAGAQLQLRNNYQTSNLFAVQAVAGSALSTAEHTFGSKPEALRAADELLSQFDELIGWRDTAATALGIIDTGGAQQALQHAVARAAGYLIEASFSLAPERRIVLDRPRSLVDLCAELYGAVDEKLDLLIMTNDLTGQEILELPAGTSIAYYA